MPFIKNLSIFARKAVAAEPVLPKIEAGNRHNFVIKLSGRVFGWGRNSNSELGSGGNNAAYYRTPVSLAGTVKTFCKIAAGSINQHGIAKNGRGWSWGSNTYGALGGGALFNSYNTPISIEGTVRTFCEITADKGYYTGAAIDKNGRAWGWGWNAYGNIGDNSTTSRLTPVSVLGAVKTFCKIYGAYASTLAIDKNGRAWAWGYNGFGNLGDNSTTQRNTPVSVAGATKTFCQIAGGQYHSLAIDKNGRAWAWGYNFAGQLGDNSINQRLTPVSVGGAVKTFCKIAGGEYNSAAIDKNGQAWCWGRNSNGQVGDNTTTSRRTPVSVVGAKKTFCDIKMGERHTIAVDKNGKVWAWGDDSEGQLGINGSYDAKTPISLVATNKTFCTAGMGLFAVIGKDNNVWGWGTNSGGQIGDSTFTRRLSPVPALTGYAFSYCQVAGYNFALGLDPIGNIWSWGSSAYGVLGHYYGVNYPFTTVIGNKTFCKVGNTQSTGAAIDKNGQAWCWGQNFYGQIGNNTQNYGNNTSPVSVLGATKTFCEISAGNGNGHFCAIDKNGRVWCWGYNGFNQLGDTTFNDRYTPVSILGGVKTFCKIVTSNYSTHAIDKNGKVWSWGADFYGMLGQNASGQQSTPVSLAGVSRTFCKIAGGYYHVVALDKNGKVWCWGLNDRGQLGNNSTTDRCSPVSVCGNNKTFCSVGASDYASFGIDKNGKIWAWGQWENTGGDATSKTPKSVYGL